MQGLPPIHVLVPLLVIASVAGVSIAGFVSKGLRNALVLVPARVKDRGQVYRLLTAGWVHADATHLLFNMISLWFFASEVARALGLVRFLILYVSAVVVGFIPTTLRHMKHPKYASLGASGAVAAVMFSAVLLYPGMRLGIAFVAVGIPGWLYAILYVAYSVWMSWRARNSGINHDAHIAGALYGAALTFAMEPQRVMGTVHAIFG
jgi:membrane associated rhomboid family serine protease